MKNHRSMHLWSVLASFSALAVPSVARACEIQFTSPEEGSIVTSSTIGVSGNASGFANPDDIGMARATVNGRVFFEQRGRFTALVNFFGSGAATATLDPGVNVLVVNGSVSGCSASDTLTITYQPPPDQPNPGKNGGGPSDPGNCPAGNPCDPATGNKFQRESDYASLGRLPLRIDRLYNSGVTFAGSFGDHWRAPWDRRISVTLRTPNVASVELEDGKVLRFDRNSAGAWLPERDVNHRLSELRADDRRTGWLLRTPDDQLERYDENGRLLVISDKGGMSLMAAYSDETTPPSIAPRPGLVLQISDDFGRSIQLRYDASARVVEATDPTGERYSYRYDAVGNLIGVTLPFGVDGVAQVERVYSYDEPALINAGSLCPATARLRTGLLTGVQDENGSRFASYGYDCQSRAVLSEHAGGAGRYRFSYTVSPNGTPISTAITDALGTVRTRTFATLLGVPRGTNHSEPCLSASCINPSRAFSLDANGNQASATDFNGNATCRSFEPARNLLLRSVDGLPGNTVCASVLSDGAPLPSDSRKTTTVHHPDWRVPVRQARPKRIDLWVYNGQPDPTREDAIATCAPETARLPDGTPIAALCKVVQVPTTDESGSRGLGAVQAGSARTWEYTYDELGHVLTSTNPRGNVQTHAYHPDTTADHVRGDLATTTNALGHTTRYSRYDRSGRVLESIDPTGLIRRSTYTPRGWLTSSSIVPSSLVPSGAGAALVTAFDYDRVGQVRSVTLPDGGSIDYRYDPAHRLVEIRDAAGNRVGYTLDALGNRIQEQMADPDGNLALTIARAYDALNRLQRATGAPE